MRQPAFEFCKRDPLGSSGAIRLPPFIQNGPVCRAYRESVVNSGKPKFLRELESLLLGELLQVGEIRECHGENLRAHHSRSTRLFVLAHRSNLLLRRDIDPLLEFLLRQLRAQG